ncbi:hypothetical protein ACIRVF_30210 [Kitasatospora sp. NPDC101157]|uniref:hypothetical protein n=1 Tax=Kitasatospora sp. NPDC101157 TaxID=3364098 RepID=UPI00380AAB61
MRLLNGREEDAPWWAPAPQQLYLHGKATGTEPLPLGGRPEPIPVDGLGDTVVGVWVNDDGSQRWSILPAPVDWEQMVAWLVGQAPPAFVPDALRRVRAPHAQTPELETDAEQTARLALEELEQTCEERKARLTAELKAARQPPRCGMACSSARAQYFEAVVATVLERAGFTITALDEDLGDTASADPLVQLGDRRRLMEVNVPALTGRTAHQR